MWNERSEISDSGTDSFRSICATRLHPVGEGMRSSCNQYVLMPITNRNYFFGDRDCGETPTARQLQRDERWRSD